MSQRDATFLELDTGVVIVVDHWSIEGQAREGVWPLFVNYLARTLPSAHNAAAMTLNPPSAPDLARPITEGDPPHGLED
jgi:hypothetical protein